MASTNFVDNSTVIYAAWLNDVNNATYNGVFAANTITPSNIVCNGTVSGSGFTSLVSNVFASPAPIGSAVPNTGAFTTLTANSLSGLTTPLSIGQGGTGLSTVGTSGYHLVSTGSALQYKKVGLGITGETWHDVTSSRAFSTTYTNANGYPIMVCVTASQSGAAGNHYLNAYINGTLYTYTVAYAGGNASPQITIIVPTGATYYFDTVGSSNTTNLGLWSELY